MWVQFTSPCSLDQWIYYFPTSLHSLQPVFTQNLMKSLGVQGHLLLWCINFIINNLDTPLHISYKRLKININTPLGSTTSTLKEQPTTSSRSNGCTNTCNRSSFHNRGGSIIPIRGSSNIFNQRNNENISIKDNAYTNGSPIKTSLLNWFEKA